MAEIWAHRGGVLGFWLGPWERGSDLCVKNAPFGAHKGPLYRESRSQRRNGAGKGPETFRNPGFLGVVGTSNCSASASEASSGG